MGKYCRSCGEQKRLTWPRDETPSCCSQGCAASAFLQYAAAGGWEASHCNKCGEPDFDHDYHTEGPGCPEPLGMKHPELRDAFKAVKGPYQ